VKSLGNFPDPFIAEIAGQPAAVRAAASGLRRHASVLVRLSSLPADARPVFTGMGSSYDACYPAVTELAVAGIAAIHVGAGELLHFRSNVLGAGDVVVAVSQSGESAEVVRLARALRERSAPERPRLVVAVTNAAGSTLAGLADATLETEAGAEVGPSTMTFAAALVVLSAVAGALAGEPVDAVLERTEREADTAATAIERILARPRLAEELAARLGPRAVTVVLGRGPARAAAEMGALTLKEAVGLPVESLETAQFRHGPLELAGPDLGAIVLATEPETRDLDLALARELAATGSAIVVIGRDGDQVEGSIAVDAGEVDRTLRPAVAIVPIQLLAWRLAIEHGREPGSYVRASKVTTRE
jgi:glucosamine--fructose-6-phosphate aminotransferase (isomerizing)